MDDAAKGEDADTGLEKMFASTPPSLSPSAFPLTPEICHVILKATTDVNEIHIKDPHVSSRKRRKKGKKRFSSIFKF